MRSSTILALLVAIISASIIPSVSIDLSLILDFSLTAGQDSNGSGSCASANNILILYFCLPNREEFIKKVNSAITLGNFLGTLVTFNINPLT
ncbi:hypothetical protein CC78DRAFT_596916 [Lojkania enalia]|uniref:Uncharacterized protein n=1 Tax=Lojkania enalia TaxID=147567 RepID=A0A9P4JYA1_9PLEO|nr:hypothetical protein CC78DRAFT_596916 [Didymosphaeria enalia]